MSLISQIFISSSDVSIEKRPGAETGLQNLKTNQVITARVLNVLNAHQVQLLIQGKKVLARTYVPLQSGEDVSLKVAGTGDPPILKLTKIKPENFFEAHRNRVEIVNRFEPYENLSKLLEKLSLSSEDGKSLHQIAEALEKIQLFNKDTAENFGKYFLPIPVQCHKTLKLGQMLIDLGREDPAGRKPENKVIKVSLLLEMSNMGKILADFSVLKNAVLGLFQVADDEIRIFIEENLYELISRLDRQGFKTHHIDCRTISPESLASTSLIDRLVENDDSFFNLII